jgi:hypothetical protein
LIVIYNGQVLKEADRLEYMNRELPKDWAFELQMFKCRLIVNAMNMLFTGFVVVIGQDVAGDRGCESRYQRV